MMQKVLTKYWLPVHVGLLLLASFFWLWQPNFLKPVTWVWLSLLAIEAFVLLPSVRRGETLVDARARVAHGAFWDPFFYVGITLVVFAGIQWLNSGRKLCYLPDANIWRFNLPPVVWLPSCVDAKDGLQNLCVLVAAVVGGVLLRQGVSPAAKRMLLQAASACSGGLALVWVARAMQGEWTAGFLQGRGVANPLGSFFGFWLVMGLGGVVDAQSRVQRGAVWLYAFAFIGNLLGVLVFASWPILSVYLVTAILLFGYWLAYLRIYVERTFQLKLFLVTLLCVAVIAVSFFHVFQRNPLLSEMNAWFSFNEEVAKLTGTLDLRVSAALKIWNDSPWTGVGPGGFRHFIGTVIKSKEWALVRTDCSYVYNDSIQFLCEHGVLGLGLMSALVITLMIPICYRARLVWLFGSGDMNDGRRYVFRLSPFVVTGVTATTFLALESLIASPFRSPALLISWLYVMAMMPAFLPCRTKK